MFRSTRGQTLTEYALALLLIAIVTIGAITALGGNVTAMFSSITVATGSESAGGPGPSAPADETAAGDPTEVCATGFEPGSEVTVNFGPTEPGSLLAPGAIGTLTADESGEVCDEVIIPVEATDGEYEFELIGTAPGGAPHSVALPPITVDGSDIDMSVPATPPEATGPGTMMVQVRSCSAIYHRANATMNSAGYLLAPGTVFEVYATNGWWDSSFSETITGGTWPAYTCDGGSDNTWYQLTDGSGYVFTGGVNILSASDMANYIDSATFNSGASTDQGIAWSGNYTASGGPDGSGYMRGGSGGPAATYGNLIAGHRIQVTFTGRSFSGGGTTLYACTNPGGYFCVGSGDLPTDGSWAEKTFVWTVPDASYGYTMMGLSYAYDAGVDNVSIIDLDAGEGVAPPPEALSGNIDTATFDAGATSTAGVTWSGTYTASGGADGSGFMKATGSLAASYLATPGHRVQMDFDGFSFSGGGTRVKICGVALGNTGDQSNCAQSRELGWAPGFWQDESMTVTLRSTDYQVNVYYVWTPGVDNVEINDLD